MAAVKKFSSLEDLLVFPSSEPTIETIVDNEYNGAHRYRIRLCTGFDSKRRAHNYIDKTVTLQFVKKEEDGTTVPGLQSEQLALILLDRVKKLNERFPHPSNEKQIAGLQMFLDACKERVQERIDRGVMGDLKK